jgi:broad specificity phosphatase PhoE
VVFVRHAEYDHDPDPAQAEDPPLSEAGEQRAACLARVLADIDITRVLTSDLQRTQQTGEPLATARGIEPEVIPARDTATFVNTLRALPPRTTALVVGHSNTLPAMVEGLGGQLRGLDENGFIERKDYGRLVVVVLGDPVQTIELRVCDGE